MGLNSGGFSPWKAWMGRGTAKRGGGCKQSQSWSKNEESRSCAGRCAKSECREINLELYLEVLVWLSSAWIFPSTKSPGKAQAWELWEWLDTGEEEGKRWETKGQHCWRSGCEYQGKEGWKQDVWFMGEKKKALELERSRGNALPCTALGGGGLKSPLVSASAGCGPKHGLNASGSSHLLETQSLFHTQPHPEPAPLQGWCPKLVPACAFCGGF